MGRQTIDITLKGSVVDRGFTRLNTFSKELDSLNSLLQKLDKHVSKSTRTTLYYRIVGLSIGSPTKVSIEPVAKNPAIDNTVQVMTEFTEGLSEISKGKIRHGYDYDILMSFSNFGKSLKTGRDRLTKKTEEIGISVNGKEILLDRDLEGIVKKMLGKDHLEQGFITGLLLALNLYGVDKKFQIYPVAGPISIDCKFKSNMIEQAISAIDRHIKLSGVIRYKSLSKYPYQINVSDMEIYPKESDLKSFSDLYGSIDLPQDKKSEEIIAEIRSDE